MIVNTSSLLITEGIVALNTGDITCDFGTKDDLPPSIAQCPRGWTERIEREKLRKLVLV